MFRLRGCPEDDTICLQNGYASSDVYWPVSVGSSGRFFVLTYINCYSQYFGEILDILGIFITVTVNLRINFIMYE